MKTIGFYPVSEFDREEVQRILSAVQNGLDKSLILGYACTLLRRLDSEFFFKKEDSTKTSINKELF